MTRSRAQRRGNAQRISNVRIVDPASGQDGAKLDRIMNSLQNSHSQTRIVCSDQFTVSVASSGAPTTVTYSSTQVRNTDDFVSLAAQFETYRITAIRYDVYDISPAVPTVSAFSTYHDVSPTPLTFSLGNIIDGEDSQFIPPGTGKVSFTWMARGTEENQFLSCNQLPNIEFGGLRGISQNSASNTQKYLIIMKAVVDFRGRY